MKSRYEQRLEKLASSGTYTDLVYGVTCGLALKVPPEEICRIIKSVRCNPSKLGRGPRPRILIDGWEIASSINCWVARPTTEYEIYSFTEGYEFDLRTKKDGSTTENNSPDENREEG